MKRLLKFVGYTAAAIIGLLAVVFISLQFVSGEQYKKWITAATESATGRRLAIDGELDVQLNTKIGLSARDVRFANSSWGSREEMATIERLFVEIRLFPLLTGVLDFMVEIDGSDVLLETGPDGTGNWVFDASPAEQTPPESEETATQDGSGSFSLPVKPYIRTVAVNDLVFAYDDKAGAGHIEAALEELRIFVDGADIPLILKGSYQGAPVELNGSLGVIEQWHANQETAVSLEGILNEANLTVAGSAGPLLPRPNTRVDIALSAGTVSTFEPFAGVTLPHLENFELSGTLAVDDGNLMLEKVEANLSDPQLSGSLAGRIRDLTGLSGIEINTEFSTEKGDGLAEKLNPGAAYTVPKRIRLTGGIGGSLEDLSIDGLELQVQDQGLDILLAADLQDVIGSPGGTANLTIDLESTSIINRHAGLELPSFGPFKGSAGIVSAGSGLAIESLQLELSDPVLSAHIDGSADNIGPPGDENFQISGIELTGSAGTEQIEEILTRFGVDLPVELPASFNLDLTAAGSLEKLGVTSLVATVKDSGMDVAVSGTVDNVMDLSGIAADLKAAVEDSAALSKYAGVAVPALGSLDLQAKLASSGDTYKVDDLTLRLDGEAADAQISANIADLLALTTVAQNPAGYGEAGIDADLALQAPSLSTLLQKAGGIDLEELGSLDLKAHLQSTADSLTLDGLQATLINDGLQTTAEGALEDLLALSGLNAEIRGDLDSLSALSALAGTELPQTGPWYFRVKADAFAETADGLRFSSELGGEGITASIDAQVADLKTFQTFQTDLQLSVDSVVRGASLFDYEIGKDTALNIDGRLNAEPGAYRLEKLVLTTDEGDVSADLSYRYPPDADLERPKIDGKIRVTGLDMSPLLAPAKETEQDTGDGGDEGAEGEAEDIAAEQEVAKADPVPNGQVEEQSETGAKIFSDEPLAVGWLNTYDADLQLEAKDLLYPKGKTGDATIRAVLDQGRLRIDPIDLKDSNGGTGAGYLSLDARDETAVLDTVIDLNNFTSPRFGGTIDLHLDLNGEGSSIASIMGSLNGYFAASLENLELGRSYMSQFGAGLLKQLNPLDSETTTLECGVVRLDIKDGIADFRKKIAAQTTEVTWLGGGKINLKTEELDVGISPKARGAISSLTTFDLASLVHVGGTLAEPKIGIDLADVAKKYAGYTAFVATGGLSFLAEKMVDTVQANVDQCERILGELEDRVSEPGAIKEQPQAEEAGDEK